MVTLDLCHLPDDVLFLTNDGFFNFVIQVCGEVEADILRVQGIRNARSLLRSTNLLSIFELDCEECDVLKLNACFKCKNGDLIIKQGVKLNLDSLYEALKEMIYVTDCSEMEYDDDDDENENDNDYSSEAGPTNSTILENNNNDSEEEYVEEESNDAVSKENNYNGMRIYSTIADKHKDTYFKINVNGNDKYMHKQTGAWCLTKKNNRLSSDRLVRVQEMNKQE